MRERLLAIPLLVALAAGSAGAEHIEVLLDQAVYGRFSLGAGARAWGMGGSALAVGGDPASASWNPAGLASLSRPAFVLDFAHDDLTLRPEETRRSYGNRASLSILESRSDLAWGRLGYAAAAIPFKVLGRPVASLLSFRRQVPYEARAGYAYRYSYRTYYCWEYDYQYGADASGGLDVMTLTLASQVVRGVGLGVNVHRWSNGFTRPVRESYANSVEGYYGWDGEWREDLSDDVMFEVSGFGLDIGALASFSGRLSAGVVYRTAVSAELAFSNTAEYRNSLTGEVLTASASGRGRVLFPASFGAGLAFRPSASVILAMDFTRVFWSKARVLDYVRAPSQGGLPAPRDYAFPSLTPPEVVSQRDTDHIHGGVEVTLRLGGLRLPLRAGFFSDGHYFYSSSGGLLRTLGYSLGWGFRWRGFVLDAAWVRSSAEGRYLQDTLKATVTCGI